MSNIIHEPAGATHPAGRLPRPGEVVTITGGVRYEVLEVGEPPDGIEYGRVVTMRSLKSGRRTTQFAGSLWWPGDEPGQLREPVIPSGTPMAAEAWFTCDRCCNPRLATGRDDDAGLDLPCLRHPHRAHPGRRYRGAGPRTRRPAAPTAGDRGHARGPRYPPAAQWARPHRGQLGTQAEVTRPDRRIAPHPPCEGGAFFVLSRLGTGDRGVLSHASGPGHRSPLPDVRVVPTKGCGRDEIRVGALEPLDPDDRP